MAGFPLFLHYSGAKKCRPAVKVEALAELADLEKSENWLRAEDDSKRDLRCTTKQALAEILDLEDSAKLLGGSRVAQETRWSKWVASLHLIEPASIVNLVKSRHM